MSNPFDYIISNDIAGLNAYLERGNINIVDEKGKSLLCYAIICHNNAAFQILIKNYINLDLADKDGNTCLHYAVINNRFGYFKVILNQNGNILKKNRFDQSPIYLACLYGRRNMLSLYMEKNKLDLSIKDSHGETIFMALTRSRLIDVIQETYNFKDFIDLPNDVLETPLFNAALKGNLDVLNFLLEHNAFINHKNQLGETPLFYAVKAKQLEAVNCLLKHGALPDIKDKEGNTVFDLPMSSDFKKYFLEKIAMYHLDNYAKKFPLHFYILTEDLKGATNYLNLLNCEAVDCFGNVPMTLAEKIGNKSLIALLKAFVKTYNVATAKTRLSKF